MIRVSVFDNFHLHRASTMNTTISAAPRFLFKLFNPVG
jgi:hypothetical protein